MKIGVVGCGVMGAAVAEAFEMIGHDVSRYDPDKGYFDDPTGDFTMVCVYYDIEKIVSEYASITNTVILKSTVPVGTTDSLNDKYKNVVYVPEFVTEATARIDARYPDKVVIGCGNEHKDELLKLHRPLEAPMMITTRSEAEMIKLVINSFYATKVEFANEVYDACSECGADYTVVRRAMELDQRIFPHHLDVMHGGYRGFGGKCLPKDIGILTGAFYMPVLQEVRRVNDLRRDGDL